MAQMLQKLFSHPQRNNRLHAIQPHEDDISASGEDNENPTEQPPTSSMLSPPEDYSPPQSSPTKFQEQPLTSPILQPATLTHTPPQSPPTTSQHQLSISMVPYQDSLSTPPPSSPLSVCTSYAKPSSENKRRLLNFSPFQNSPPVPYR